MRPLSDANPELKYDVSTDKPFKSTNDIRSLLLNQNRPECESMAGNSIYKRRLQFSPDESNGIESDDPTEIKSSRLLVAGNKRNLPKHQRPLTRYLPIMSVDLDLRHHIESAGHQVLLCPHVILDATSCRGCVQSSLSQHAVFAIFANPRIPSLGICTNWGRHFTVGLADGSCLTGRKWRLSISPINPNENPEAEHIFRYIFFDISNIGHYYIDCSTIYLHTLINRPLTKSTWTT